MRRIALGCLLTASALLVGGAPATAEEHEPIVVPERQGRDALYAWLDEVGYPDGVGGETVLLRDRQPEELAFVLGRADDDSGTRVFGIDGVRRVVPDDPTTDNVDTEPVAIPVDLVRAVRDRLHTLERGREDGDDFFREHGWTLPERTRLVILARRVKREGDADLEASLLTAAAHQPGVMERPRRRSGKPLDELVRRDVELFERVTTWGWDVMAADFATRRTRLLRFAALFSDSEFAERATAQAATLARMTLDEGSVPTIAEIADLTGDALARGLVLRLRHQTSWGEAMGGAIAHTNGTGESPLDRLMAMGEPALPALLDAFGDPTLTPVVSTGRVGLHPNVHTVGDLAREGVQVITGQWFSSADEARAWLARRASEGEAALLAAQVFQGNWIDTGAARRLVEIDPAAAAQTLEELLQREMTNALRVQLISELGNAQHDDITEILRAECADDRRFPIRLIAAQQLVRRDGAAARAVFLELWREDAGLDEIHYPANQPVVVAYQDRQGAWQRLIPELVAMGSWDEIAALLPEKTPWTRAMMLAQLAASAPSPFAGDAVSRLLLDGLSDHSDTPRDVGTRALVNCCDARVSDLLGAELAARNDAWSSYPAQAAREDRDVALAEIRNALRVAMGEEPRIGPVARHIVPLTDEDVAPLVEAFATDDLDALDRAEDAVATAGLEGLPALRRSSAAGGAAGRASFQRGLRRLGSTVGRVIVRDGADERYGERLQSFQGRPLDANALVSALRELLGDGIPLTLLVHRPADDTGCTLVAAPPAASQRFRLDMGGAMHRYLDDDAWKTVREFLQGGARTSVSDGWSLLIRLR